MAISVMFSAIIYRQTTDQFRAGTPRQRYIKELIHTLHRFIRLIFPHFAESHEEVAAPFRFVSFFSMLVFGFTSVASYFLAKRTLRRLRWHLTISVASLLMLRMNCARRSLP